MKATMRSVQLAQFILVVGAILLFEGCESKKLPPVGSAAPPMTNTGAPLTEADAKAFSSKLVQAINAGDTTAADHLLRTLQIAENSISSLDPPRGFMDGLRKEAGKMSMAKQLSTLVQQGGSYKLLRIRTESGRPMPVFRLLLPTGGLNYHDMTLVRYPDGDVGAEDIQIAISSEKLSQTMRRIFIPLLAANEKSLFKKVSDSERQVIENITMIEDMGHVIRNEGNAAETFQKFRALPAESQNNKVLQVLALQVAQRVGEKEYGEELERFQRNFPTDPALNILSIDYFALKKKYPQVLESIDKLDTQVGGDPYLEVMRGNLFELMQDWAKAKKSFAKAIEKEPDLFQAYDLALALSLKNSEHDETLDLFKKYIDNCGFKFDANALMQQASYRSFVKTPQFQELKKWYVNRK